MAPTNSETQSLRDWLLSVPPASPRQAKLGRFYAGWLEFKANRLAMLGLAIITLLILTAIFAPWLATHSPVGQTLTDRLQPPSAQHWLGTDELGRDIYSRIVYGSRLTLYIIGIVAIVVGPVGLTVGTVAGYLGGWVDRVLMRITDIFLAFPRLILALAFVSALGPGIENAVLAIAITVWPPYARMARAETITVRNADYIAAVRIQGGSTARIIGNHVVPMCMSLLPVVI
jgi:peptide/nickel transport system permease protein